METSQVTTTLPTIWLSLPWLVFRSTLLIVSTLDAGPTAHREDGVQPVRVRTRIRVCDHLSSFSVLGIGDSPFDLLWIEWFLERRHQSAHFFVGVFFSASRQN